MHNVEFSLYCRATNRLSEIIRLIDVDDMLASVAAAFKEGPADNPEEFERAKHRLKQLQTILKAMKEIKDTRDNIRALSDPRDNETNETGASAVLEMLLQ